MRFDSQQVCKGCARCIHLAIATKGRSVRTAYPAQGSPALQADGPEKHSLCNRVFSVRRETGVMDKTWVRGEPAGVNER